MHNIGRTVGEASHEFEGHEFEGNEFESGHEYEGNEFEGGHEYEGHEFESSHEDEFLNELHELHETSHESHETQGEAHEMAGEYETSHESHEVNHEAMEMELATELLGVSNEMELEEFLGKLVRRAAGAVKSFANSSAGRAIGGVLKAAAKKALPIVGKVAGSFFGGPVGGMIGGKLGSLASNLFELELEGLSNEDKEFELARAYVRFANDAVRRAAHNPNFRFQPRRIARNAVIAAARRNAPGLLRRNPLGNNMGRRPMPSAPRPTFRNTQMQSNNGYINGFSNGNGNGNGNGAGQQSATGTWYQQGDQIILNLS